jgi:hypothetical protein
MSKKGGVRRMGRREVEELERQIQVRVKKGGV